MRRRALALVAVAAFAKTSPAQVASPPTVMAAGATVAEADSWGAAENPAAAPGSAAGLAARAYGYDPLDLGGLARFGLDVALATEATSLQFAAQAFAPPGYRAYALHAAVGRQLGEGLRAGLRLGGVVRDLDEYGTETLPVVQAGLRYAVVDDLAAAAHYTYVERALLPLAEHRLRLGVDYASSTRVHLLAAVWQPAGRPLAGGVGVRFAAAERLRLSAGVQSGGTAFTLGVEGEIAAGTRVALALALYQELPAGVGYGVDWGG